MYGAIYKTDPSVMDKEDLKKYFSKALDAGQMHQLEQSSQSDPFAFEAMEGYEQMGLAPGDLMDLDQKLKKRVFPDARMAWWKITSMAASIGIVLGLFGGWLLFGLKDELQSKTVSQNSSIVLADSNAQNSEVKAEQDFVTETETSAGTIVSNVEPVTSNPVPISTETAVQSKNDIQEDAPVITNELQLSVTPKASEMEPEREAKRSVAKPSAIVSSSPILKKSEAQPIPVIAAADKKSAAISSAPASVSTKSPSKPSPEIVRFEEKTEAKQNVSLADNSKSIKSDKAPIAALAKKKGREKPLIEEPPYKKAGEEISLSGLADMLQQDKNEAAQSSKADGASAPVLVPNENKKPEVFKYDYDKADAQKVKPEASGREKKSKIKIPLDVLPSNITFEDYVRIKLRDKAYKCPKKGIVKLFVNLDKNKKIEDFTILEVNNKVCVDYAKAIVEDWIIEKVGMYDENRAYQFIINFN